MAKFSYFEPEEDTEVIEECQPLSATDVYIDFLFPTLPAGESIAISRKIHSKFFRTEFVDKEYLKRRLNDGGLKDCDTYISLSTVTSGAKTKEAKNMRRRNCLGFDFDKKSFQDKNYTTIQDFTKHFHSTTGLYIHFAVDSGHGYHFYVGIEETTDIARVTAITRRFAVLSGADKANISDAQTLRLPGTLNHKDRDFPLSVNIVFQYKEEGFRRYTLNYLESKLKKLERAAGISRPVNHKKAATRKFRGIYPCIAAMLDKGVPKGERNKCLGRIVSYFRDVAKIPKSEALETVLTWNEKCNSLCDDLEKKSEKEVTKDFERYWTPNDNKEYSLLGCISNRNSFSPILAKYCDEARCPKRRRNLSKDSTQLYILDGRYATDNCLRTLKGYAYLILKVLLDSKKAYKVSELIAITGLSQQKVSRSLKALTELHLVIKSAKGVATYKTKNYSKVKQRITLPVKLFDLLTAKEITEQKLRLYIAIRRNAYAGQKCTYEALGKVLDLDKHHVYMIVRRMIDKGLLEKEHKPTGKFIKIGGTKVEKTFNFYWFPLEIQDAEEASYS